ncbi:uncharacterized protein LTR77_005921 [Saxophila tyrrhenica]|uniref:NYN domain-containing protein n=1 Tax=Saxophila tyrrhenica TaxID=1690608 RepID=A0AAV9P716_9PEZI|nr:hypothetical protein LTR77_005921 [Saxophila tyrrhenica]
MALPMPISILEAIGIVQKGVALYKTIRKKPEEIAAVGRRMQDLEFYLSELQALVDDKQRNPLPNLRPEQTQRIGTVISDIRVDAGDVYEILCIWDSAGSFQKVLFTVGRNPRRLDELNSSLEQRRQDLRDILQLMGLFALKPPSETRPTSPAAPTRADYGVIFVDPFNLGRSKVAEGYMKLIREWTVRTGGAFKVKFAHSAGMLVRDRSDCVDFIESLPGRMVVNGVAKEANAMAMASLFDNKYFDYTFKPGIRASMMKRAHRTDAQSQSRARGITQNIFKTYDYILVFTGREYERLLLLKKGLLQAHGPSIAPASKGRIIHLGAYLNKKGKPNDIADARKDENEDVSRANWNTTTSQIKLAVKAFLKNELGWQQPERGAVPAY